MREVTLAQMLMARENRVLMQQKLLDTYRCPLICFTMNIAGPVKTSPLIERAFMEGLNMLEDKLSKENILSRHIDISHTGCEAMLAVDANPATLKDICTSIEDGTHLGRLFDMDVLDTNGAKLSRKTLRGCIVCGAPGRDCAAGRLHSVQELQSVTQKIINQYFSVLDCNQIADLATESLLEEVYTTPKPGLVDKRNNGSHVDMDINTFVKSANCLKPYFSKCMAIGQKTANRTPEETFLSLRQAGILAEKVMYETTEGVNTHKGVIYSMGIICGALGRLWTPQTPIAKPEDILFLSGQIASAAVQSDFSTIDGSTAGGKFYLEYGLTGIRGEVAAGFPSVTNIGLPAYQKGLDNGLSSNDAGAIALLHLISKVLDTNLYHRGGQSGALYAAEAAKTLLKDFKVPSLRQIETLDDDFISRNLSPGGCADLLAITYFIYKLKRL